MSYTQFLRPRRRPASRGPARPRAAVDSLESLEPRVLFAFDPSAREQEMLELLNRMRTDPAGEYARLTQSTDPHVNGAIDFFDVDLDLLAEQWSTLEAAAPLAWNTALYNAAVDHSVAMRTADQQSHQLPGEQSLADRITTAGYTNKQAWGENVYAFTENVFHGHAGFAVDWGEGPGGIQDPAGHRDNMMDPTFREVGIGIVEGSPGFDTGPLLVTQDFGTRFSFGDPFVLGVVYKDADADNFYDAGEGIAGATVTLTGSGGTFTATSLTAGGYQVKVPNGTYTLTATGAGLEGTVSLGDVVVAGHNVKRDLTPSMVQFTSFADGVLRVNGTAGDDLINVQLSTDKTALRIRRNGLVTSHPLAGVRRLHVFAGDGNDLIDTSTIAAPTYLDGEAGHDTLRTGRGDDRLNGGTGKDRLSGMAGADRLAGGVHADLLYGGDGNDSLLGGYGHDTLHGEAGTDRLWGEADNDLLLAGPGGNRLVGGDGDDTLTGGVHPDLLDAGAGDDRLLGGLGAPDTLLGGPGSDAAEDDPLDTRSDIELLLA
jgi:hypothetical protein